MLKAIHPILGTRDLERALEHYVQRLGFTLAFRDPSAPDNYAGVKRDNVELHIQWQDEREMSTLRLRILVDDPDALFEEYRGRQALRPQVEIASTPWGTREFALYDRDGNALTFYRDLTAFEHAGTQP
jgi:catechol 2,3-dioxygenase-like lactoylglutathione lyase family enzyme